ncbi:MAG: hypothetical protein MZU97_05435 [Bacillus subtilis]|nr:hypothetical protein [Bacillus subtilis]
MDEYRIDLEKRLGVLTASMRQNRLTQHEHCTVCHRFIETEEAKLKNFNGYYVPIHDSCADQLVQTVQNEVASEQKRWFLLPVSALFALIGGLIGLIPVIVVFFVSSYYIGILYALIPLAALYGYRLGRAPKNFLMIAVIVVITLFLSVGFIYLLFSLIAIADNMTFDQLLADPLIADEFNSNLTSGIVFGFIGIALAWRSITKTSSKKVDSVQSLKNQ